MILGAFEAPFPPKEHFLIYLEKPPPGVGLAEGQLGSLLTVAQHTSAGMLGTANRRRRRRRRSLVGVSSRSRRRRLSPDGLRQPWRRQGR